MQEMWVLSLDLSDPRIELQKDMAIRSSILTWEIP